MTERRPIPVSDHAVLRWLERVEGFDVEMLRRRIAEAARIGVMHGAHAVVVDGGKLVIENETVVTVLRPAQIRTIDLEKLEVTLPGYYVELFRRAKRRRGA